MTTTDTDRDPAIRTIPARPALLDSLPWHRPRPHRHAAHWWTRHRRTAKAIIAKLTRPTYGADDEYVTELRAIGADLILTGDLLAATQPWTSGDYLDAWPGWDATEVALLAASRRLDATDVWAGGLR